MTEKRVVLEPPWTTIFRPFGYKILTAADPRSLNQHCWTIYLDKKCSKGQNHSILSWAWAKMTFFLSSIFQAGPELSTSPLGCKDGLLSRAICDQEGKLEEIFLPSSKTRIFLIFIFYIDCSMTNCQAVQISIFKKWYCIVFESDFQKVSLEFSQSLVRDNLSSNETFWFCFRHSVTHTLIFDIQKRRPE